jgi:mono/diheme cytochrome c family protein
MRRVVMRRGLLLVAIGCVVSATTLTVFGQDSKVERGKYLVDEVGRCQECHTPKTETGEFDKSRWMKGATLVGVPSSPVADWHQKSPDITSTSALWTRWGQDGFSKFLQTARNPRGGKAGPPMPAYMLKAEDADAIAAYLKSLP